MIDGGSPTVALPLMNAPRFQAASGLQYTVLQILPNYMRTRVVSLGIRMPATDSITS